MATFLKLVLFFLLLCSMNRAYGLESPQFHTLQITSLLPSSVCNPSSKEMSTERNNFYPPPYFASRRLLQATNRSSPSGPNFGTVFSIALVILGVLAITIFIASRCKMAIRSTVISNLKSMVVAQPAANLAHVWVGSVDAPTMEKFFREIAKEKPVRFSAQQLYLFTGNCSTRLGSGGFGVVYKGQFPNGAKIAVKVLNRRSDKAVEQQFMAEVGTIGRTYHVNLVRLYGFCYDQFMSALVYEYMENGSLDKYLFSDTHTIEWEKLHEVAIGTSKGIAYLHEECAQRIIHYDIKPGNVLLDQCFSPKVADFGLAKLCNHDITHVSFTGYKGTPGYSAPEVFLNNYPITHKCDVYSFGMLLFEIVGRRKNRQNTNSPTDSMDWFPKHVWDEYEKGALDVMAESCGIEEKDRKKAERAAMVALWCVQDYPGARPPMSAVVKMLEGEVEIMPPPKPFQFLFSIETEVLKPTTNGSDYSTSEGSNSCWYKESTPIMTKYEIEFANSDYSKSV